MIYICKWYIIRPETLFINIMIWGVILQYLPVFCGKQGFSEVDLGKISCSLAIMTPRLHRVIMTTLFNRQTYAFVEWQSCLCTIKRIIKCYKL